MSDDYFGAGIIGVMVGVLITLLAYNALPTALHRANYAIEQCELTIPRDQNCVITAVIEESGE